MTAEGLLFIIVMACLLGLSGVFSSAETAVFSLGAGDLRALRESGGRSGRLMDRLLRRRRPLLVSILLANLTINILYFNTGVLLAGTWPAGHVARLIVPPTMLIFLILFGEILPKVLAVHHGRRVALLTVWPLLWTGRVLRVPMVVLSATAIFLSRLLMGRRSEEGELEGEELEKLLELAVAGGELGRDEYFWLQALLRLSSARVREVMTPRVDIVAFPRDGERSEFVQLVSEHRFNKVPVHDGDLDRIEGYLDARDVLTRPKEPLQGLLRAVTFVPETATVAAVADQMLSGEDPIGVIVDEYGGTEGIVTREDLLEAVVGDLADEWDDPRQPVVRLGPGRFEVTSSLGIGTWARLAGADVSGLPVGTLGGLVTMLLGRLPEVGDEVGFGHVRLKVLSLRGRRPDRVEILLTSAKGATP